MAFIRALRRTRRIRARVWIPAACLMLAGLFYHAILQHLIEAVAGTETGTRITADSSQIGLSSATFLGVSVRSTSDEPLARIERLDVRYDLSRMGDSRRIAGIQSIDVIKPAVTILRRADGTYNVPLPSSTNGPARALSLIVSGKVVDGTVTIADERANQTAPLRFQDVNAAFDIDTSAHTAYAASLVFVDGNRTYPIRGTGSADSAPHTMLQHWSIAKLPVARIATFAADDPRLRVNAGMLDDVDAIYAGFPQAGETMDTHLAATARLVDGELSIAGLTAPVRRVSGRLDLSNSGVTTGAIIADVAGTQVRLAGGIFDFSKPTLRVAASGRAALSRVHTLIANASLAPLRGTAAFSSLAMGPAANPTVLAAMHAEQSAYGAIPIDSASALAAVDARGADLLAFRGAGGSATLFSAGRAAFAKGAGSTGILIHVRVPASTFDEARSLLPGMTVTADAFAASNDPANLRLTGTIFGRSASQNVLGAFDTNARGAGTFGPLRVDGALGSLYARGRFDAAHSSFTALASAHDFALDAIPGQRPPLADGAVLAHFNGTQGSVAARGMVGGGRVAAYGTLGSRGVVNVVANDVDVGTIHTNGATIRSGKISFGATIAGDLRSPRAAGAIAMGQGTFDGRPIDASASFAAERATVRISGALASFGSALVGLDGRIRDAGTLPAYDLAVHVRGADLHDLAQIADPNVAPIVDGSADADIRVAGTGAAMGATGSFDAPEGSFNGLAFRSLTGSFAGSAGSISVGNGSVSVGSTAMTFRAGAAPGRETIALNAPSVDLADFNDFFDRGDVLAGRGRLNFSAAAAGDRVVATTGSGFFSNARVLQFPLGTTRARWSTSQENLAMNVALDDPSGRAGIVGSMRLSDDAMNLRGYERGIDVAQWLALSGAAIPIAVTGRADADVTASGRYPRMSVSVRGNLHDGTANGIPIQQATFAGHLNDGRGTVDSAALRIPYLEATANGTFGLTAHAPLHLSVHAVTPDAAQLAHTVTGKVFDAAGAVDTTLAIAGTAADPILSDRLSINDARYGQLSFPRATASMTLDRRHAALQQAEIDLQKGRLTASAAFPLRRSAGSFALGAGPVAASVHFDDVELSNFAAMLPKGSTLSGRIDGTANLGGTSVEPDLSGTVALAGGTFSSPQVETPLTSLGATLTAHGSTIDLLGMHANAGSGTLDATGRASAPSLLDSNDVTLAINAAARGAQVDFPAYFKGRIDGTLAFARTPGSIPRLQGDVTVSHARLPVSAFLQASGASGGTAPPNVALDLNLHAGSDVRVQSPNVDVGGTGSVAVTGTLDAPSADGRIDATGGSIDFYRNFRVQSGRVSFAPDDGLIPDVHAVATTYIADPQTDVTISVTGRVTNMQLGLNSDPNYDRTQILALLAGAGSTSPFSATGQAENLAFGQANQMFTRQLLDPLSANLGSALGLANLDLYNDIGEGFGFSAKQKLGDHLTATGSESFGAQRRQDLEVAYHKSDASALQLHLYQQQPILFNPAVTQASVGNVVFNMTSATIPPIDGGGTAGISLSLQRRFW
jgi:autotransporter translocation and assembly factor TamB